MKKVAVFFSNGFEEVESITVVDYLRRADITVDMVSTTGNIICKGAHDIDIKMDILLEDISEYDGYIIPGGTNNAISMRKNKKLLEIIKKANDDKKLVAAICAGPAVLNEAGILKGVNITSYPSVFKEDGYEFNYVDKNVVVDGNIITSRGPALTISWSLEIIEYLCSKDKRKEIEKQILAHML